MKQESNLTLTESQSVIDIPTHVDAFGYDAYSEAISNLLCHSETPLTVGIHGDWGTGKTSLMAMIERRVNPLKVLSLLIEADSEGRKMLETELAGMIGEHRVQNAMNVYQPFLDSCKSWRQKGFSPKCNDLKLRYEEKKAELYQLLYSSSKLALDTVWFDTWQHDNELTVWAALLATITQYLRNNPRYPMVESQLDRLTKLVERAAKPISIFVSAATGGAVESNSVESLLKPDKAMIGYREELQRVVDTSISGLGSSATHRNVLLIFIDDLDRCSPTTVISLLERIKAFFDTKGCIFMLAASEEVIASGIEAKGVSSGYQNYFKGKGSKYLEKIIQLPFHLPPLTTEQRKQLLEELPLNDDVRQATIRLLPYFAPNPRQLKRFVNAVTLQYEILRAKVDRQQAPNCSLSSLARFLLIRFEWEDTYRALVEYGYDFYQQLWSAVGTSHNQLEGQQDEQEPIWKEIQQALQKVDLCRLIKGTPLISSIELSCYLTLTRLV